jgi:hypothetical protein
MSFKVTVEGPTDPAKRVLVSGNGVPPTYVASGETKTFTTAPGAGMIHCAEANA